MASAFAEVVDLADLACSRCFCLDRNERVTFWCGACVGFRIALMENVRTYISEGQLGAVEGRGLVAEERVEISEDAAFEDKTKTAERLADQSPLARGIRQAFMYYGVSIVQTFVEFGVFALAQLALPTGVANGIAVACSGSFNFLMNRNITFKASSNFWRSVAMFIALYVWNFLFGTWFIGWAAASFGCPEMVGKFITMAMQGIWGFCLCKWVIFR